MGICRVHTDIRRYYTPVYTGIRRVHTGVLHLCAPCVYLCIPVYNTCVYQCAPYSMHAVQYCMHGIDKSQDEASQQRRGRLLRARIGQPRNRLRLSKPIESAKWTLSGSARIRLKVSKPSLRPS